MIITIILWCFQNVAMCIICISSITHNVFDLCTFFSWYIYKCKQAMVITEMAIDKCAHEHAWLTLFSSMLISLKWFVPVCWYIVIIIAPAEDDQSNDILDQHYINWTVNAKTVLHQAISLENYNTTPCDQDYTVASFANLAHRYIHYVVVVLQWLLDHWPSCLGDPVQCACVYIRTSACTTSTCSTKWQCKIC